MSLDFNHFKTCLLIAMPDLKDPNFDKSVVLLTDYNETGASGFVINRPTQTSLKSALILETGQIHSSYSDLNLWTGGPVETDQLWIIYDGRLIKRELDDELGEGLMIARSLDILTGNSSSIPASHFRVLHGYSGWGAKQLDVEIARSSWLTLPLNMDLLFNTPTDQIWTEAVRLLGFDPMKLVGPQSVYIN